MPAGEGEERRLVARVEEIGARSPVRGLKGGAEDRRAGNRDQEEGGGELETLTVEGVSRQEEKREHHPGIAEGSYHAQRRVEPSRGSFMDP